MIIGNIDYGTLPIFLAPMEDVTDLPFRLICKEYGADMVYTEFVSSDGLIRNITKTKNKLFFLEQERPIGVQIYGHLKESMVEAARIAEEMNPDIIDINFGCPVKKIANRGAGSGMLKNVPLMIDITQSIVKTVKKPVTVKTRIGYDEKTKNIIEVAEKLQDVGIKAITIHGRTREQMYKGTADWNLIGEVKNNPRIKIPVIGNGDINSPQKAKEAFEKYGVDAIMIGRATIGRPWIFKEIKTFFYSGTIPFPPTVNEIIEVIKKHIDLSYKEDNEIRTILHMRRHFAQYFKGLPHFRDLRIELLTVKTIKGVYDVLDKIKEKYDNKRVIYDI